ncbi:alanine racemase [Helicobacter saguini]|uniref:Alanine racemase n=1 Tax=Helicobacter saguini TaxID=1548018 RepID=A0A347VUN1_9HELI|nr:alanine racemase [Helicobacter saguini]MWV62767.1 alanine racemase [Helicobacter saguini]MWV66563.1 alanine racemase [Helicobacter saguini]MWV68913.1 alanine racemase [Helicobacter saguini]MWV71533.1 alanine racemase [Helicobacter saguini]TLD93630.1 alanine racemase [Helicobacter saguini]
MAYITIDSKNFKHNLDVIRKHLDSINMRLDSIESKSQDFKDSKKDSKKVIESRTFIESNLQDSILKDSKSQDSMLKDSKKIEIGAVLKDNAYGHGLDLMSDLCMQNNIESAFVKNYDEALKIAHKFKHITFFYGKLPRDFDKKIKNIYVSVPSLEFLESLKCECGSSLKDVGVELKVNIGMNRNGVELNEIESCIDMILGAKMRLVGVFSHNGYGDDKGDEYERERANFAKIKKIVREMATLKGFEVPRFHSLNSSAALRAKSSDDDLIRAGIAMYGYLCADVSIESSKDLKPILKLYAQKIATRSLQKGEKIGYGGRTIIESKGKISTYDIGYGDGFYRLNGRKKVLLPCGLEMLPKTSMDCFSCFSELPEILVMDNAAYIAKIFDTIPYEVLTRLSPFIKRIVV